jgi:His/Glu/Gln/Arg/opine family amino acid ABC transporter permease subunit
MPSLVQGALTAILVVVCAEAIGTALGLVIALCRLSRRWWLRWPALVYVDVIRGTPMLVQILFAYFALPDLLLHLTGDRYVIPALGAGIAALGLNSAAYVSEVYRAAISAIDRGQTEAARALGLSRVQTLRYIVLPQAFRLAVPPLGNEFITLLKDTSLLSVISVSEILYNGQNYGARTYAVLPSYVGVALVYLALTIPTTSLLRVLERRLKVPA